MRKLSPRKPLVLTGLGLILLAPFTAIFATPALAVAFCNPQMIKGVEICPSSPGLALLVTLALPIAVGVICITLSVLPRK